ncbi:MAG: hypothetical protein RSB67_00500 [Clostridia bacterium]
MKNINDCIYCLNCKIESLENRINCILSLLEHCTNSNIIIDNYLPSKDIGKIGDIYIQLKGGVFYIKNNGNWDIIGTLEPLIVDGGDRQCLKRGND